MQEADPWRAPRRGCCRCRLWVPCATWASHLGRPRCATSEQADILVPRLAWRGLALTLGSDRRDCRGDHCVIRIGPAVSSGRFAGLIPRPQHWPQPRVLG
jgi:hypothetical protein